jgi:hypothetical protein
MTHRHRRHGRHRFCCTHDADDADDASLGTLKHGSPAGTVQAQLLVETAKDAGPRDGLRFGGPLTVPMSVTEFDDRTLDDGFVSYSVWMCVPSSQQKETSELEIVADCRLGPPLNRKHHKPVEKRHNS